MKAFSLSFGKNLMNLAHGAESNPAASGESGAESQNDSASAPAGSDNGPQVAHPYVAEKSYQKLADDLDWGLI